MAYLENYKYDIFISYSRIDNKRDIRSDFGWVTSFKSALETRLSQLIGKKDIKIWQDKEEIYANQDFMKTIDSAISNSACFIAITSMGYLKSDYCKDELKSFFSKANREPIGHKVDDLSRIFNIKLNKIDIKDWPMELQGATGFPFNEDIVDDDHPTLNKELNPESDNFDTRIRLLAISIKETMERMRAKAKGNEQSKQLYKVYISTSTNHNHSNYLRLKNELETLSLEVIEPPSPRDNNFENLVSEKLRSSHISVHLFDKPEGLPIGDEIDINQGLSQLKIARNLAVNQWIWISSDLIIEDLEHDDLKTILLEIEGARYEGQYELWRGGHDPVQWASEIHRAVKKKHFKNNYIPKNKSALLEAQEKDGDFTIDIVKYLTNNNIIPRTTHYDTSLTPEAYDQYLKGQLDKANAVIIIYGNAESDWVSARLIEDINYMCTKKISCIPGVYLASPKCKKSKIDPGLPWLKVHYFDNRNGFDPDVFREFLSFIKDKQ